jgi:hypothetical protein
MCSWHTWGAGAGGGPGGPGAGRGPLNCCESVSFCSLAAYSHGNAQKLMKSQELGTQHATRTPHAPHPGSGDGGRLTW